MFFQQQSTYKTIQGKPRTSADHERTLSIEKAGNPKLIVGHVESIVEICNVLVWVEFVEVDKVGTMSVDEGIEAKAIPPTCREVINFDTSIPKKKQMTTLHHFRFSLFCAGWQ